MTTTSKNIELIVKQWTTFDFKRIQHDLDITTNEIASRAEESEQSRKRLVDLSREFKKNTTEDVRKTVAPILKSFQNEVDNLLKRSKAAEKAFLEIYRNLSDLSDPAPALEYAQALQKRAEKVSDLEVENQKLRETLDEYNHEFADVKNQEVTIKQLREKIKDLEDKTESAIQQRIKEKEKELQRIFGEKERQLQNQQFDLVTKYAEMENRQAQLQATLDRTHQDMFEYKSKQDDITNARSSEIEILNQDLERANERASTAERLVDKLREKLEQAEKSLTSTSNKINSDDSNNQEDIERKLREKLELEVAAKEREIAALVIDTQKLQSTLIKVKETSVTQISDLENVLNAKEKLIAQLENKLQCQSDYNEIKRELTILKSIEFSSLDHSNDNQSNTSSKKSLEVLLLEKNRALQNEQIQMKVANSDLESNNHNQSYRHCSLSSQSPNFFPLNTKSINFNKGENMTKSFDNSSSNIVSILSSNNDQQSSNTSLSIRTDSNPVSSKTNAPIANSFPTFAPVQLTKLNCGSPSKSSPNNLFEPLDTVHVANVVRQILAQNNIGQRVFARHILSLSQGTVSELLSKPKLWVKLTEKGKESYRKMWAWANSNDEILALKSINPRKGSKDNLYPTMTKKITQKSSRTPSTSSTSSRPNSPLDHQTYHAISKFAPSLLMQTSQRLQNESYTQCTAQTDNYKNWLMLREIAQNEDLSKQVGQRDDHDSSDNNVDIPLDLSRKNESDHQVNNNNNNNGNHVSTSRQNKSSFISICEQDLSKYSQIDTTELVRSIRDILCRYSISQKHFGEKVLNLSQGSVSDILARPKQWEQLTQKGREPFIRMRLFLDDPNAIKQLTQNCSSNIIHSNEHSNDYPSNEYFSSSSSSSPLNETTNNEKLKSKFQNQKQTRTKSRIPPYALPKIILPNDIDTEKLTSDVRDLLSAHSIGQRVFGEAVLNLSQGTVSEILSKPRTWHALSVKGREPYIRMYTWFHDKGNVQKLLAWKKRRDATKHSNLSIETTEHTNEIATNVNSIKQQYLLTDDQHRVLQQTFENEPNPTDKKLEQLVHELSLPINKLSTWFENARMRTNMDTISSLPLGYDDNNNDDDDDGDDDDDDNNDDDDDGGNDDNHSDKNDNDEDSLPTIVPLNSSWINYRNDSDSLTSPISLSTNIISSNDDQKSILTIPTSSSSSSKKRKSIPQKLITTKKLIIDTSITENPNSEQTSL